MITDSDSVRDTVPRAGTVTIAGAPNIVRPTPWTSSVTVEGAFTANRPVNKAIMSGGQKQARNYGLRKRMLP